MTRYHVNPESGRPNICKAQIKCDFAVDGQEPPHFETKAEAKVYAETKMTEEYGATAKVVKSANKPKKLTPAQKERQKGREHAEEALTRHDPDALLKYANQHDAFAKGYTARLQEESDKNATVLAEAYFDENIASGYGEIPSDHLDNLRSKYINDVLANPDARKELKKRSEEKAAQEKANEFTIQRETIETKARTLRVGDIITGEKFTNSGKWVEDDSAEIVKIEPFVDINMNTELKVTYADGHEGILGNGSNVKVKRDKNRISNNPVSPSVIRASARAVMNDAENGLLIKKEPFNKIMEYAKQDTAGIDLAHRLDRISLAMEDNNQHDPSIKASAAATRIRMSYDKDYSIDRGDAFNLLYDKDNTDSKLFNKLENDYPSVARSAAKSRENRAEINKQKAERGDTQYA